MIKLEEKRSIYDVVWIVYSEATKKYLVINMMDKENWRTLWCGESKEIAVEVKTAYCKGYYDRKQEENDND